MFRPRPQFKTPSFITDHFSVLKEKEKVLRKTLEELPSRTRPMEIRKEIFSFQSLIQETAFLEDKNLIQRQRQQIADFPRALESLLPPEMMAQCHELQDQMIRTYNGERDLARLHQQLEMFINDVEAKLHNDQSALIAKIKKIEKK